MSNNIETALELSALFRNMTPDQIKQVVSQLQPKPITLKNGEHLYNRGDVADCCWEILSGRFLLQRSSLRHPFQPINYHYGSVTGLLGLVEPGVHRPVSLYADGDAKLIEIRGDNLHKLDYAIRMIIWENISHILIKKLFQCRDQLNTLSS